MIKNKFKRIIVILILIVLLFPYGCSLALTSAEAGEILANYAYSFCMKYGENSGNNQTIYDHDNAEDGPDRPYGYRLELHSGTAQSGDGTKNYQNKYPMDCVNFVSAMIHHSLGIGDDHYDYFITPQSGVYTDDTKPGTKKAYFVEVSGEWQKGDVLRRSGEGRNHVAIYLGDSGIDGYNIAHSTFYNGDFMGATLAKKSSSYLSEFKAYRFSEDVAAAINEANCNKEAIAGVGVSSNMAVNQSEFYYNGVPNGQYSVSAGLLEWIVDALKDIFIYLINIIFYILRMIPVGFTAIVENLITYIIKTITGVEANMWDDSTRTSSEGDITIESIIFGSEIDDVNVFDVNFFKVQNTTP